MPILKRATGGLQNIDEDTITGKGVPLNQVIYGIKVNIRMVRPFIKRNPNAQSAYIQLIDMFEDELEPYIDSDYYEEIEREEEKLYTMLTERLNLTPEKIEKDEDGSILMERYRIKYRMLNRLLCKKNLYPPKTFIDNIEI